MNGELSLTKSSGPLLPTLIESAGEKAAWRFLEFFTANIRDPILARPMHALPVSSCVGAKAGVLRASRMCRRCT